MPCFQERANPRFPSNKVERSPFPISNSKKWFLQTCSLDLPIIRYSWVNATFGRWTLALTSFFVPFGRSGRGKHDIWSLKSFRRSCEFQAPFLMSSGDKQKRKALFSSINFLSNVLEFAIRNAKHSFWTKYKFVSDLFCKHSGSPFQALTGRAFRLRVG